ncbi:MAG: hypothetical protein FJX77_05420 [Armatimonadetes bacterium]|nr:hypothetical protein [Armatimonadota bacterium]
MIDVLRVLPAGQVLDPGYRHGTATQRTYLALVQKSRAQTLRARSGQIHDLGGGCRLEILAPADPPIQGTDADVNNNSIVARLVFGRTRFLFTGDMETAQRRRLLDSTQPQALQSDVLKVAHHGSYNGTDRRFLQAVAPRYSVISCAVGNEHGYPHRDTLAELKSLGGEILRTDQLGDIEFHSDGQSVWRAGSRPPSEPGSIAGGSAQPGPASPGGSPPAPPAPVRRGGPVIANVVSQVYHSPRCVSLPGRSRQRVFASAAEAEARGYRPHRECQP